MSRKELKLTRRELKLSRREVKLRELIFIWREFKLTGGK